MHVSSSATGRVANGVRKVRGETPTLGQEVFVSLGLKYWGKQVCEIGLMADR